MNALPGHAIGEVLGEGPPPASRGGERVFSW
jgi:hypothetical protein